MLLYTNKANNVFDFVDEKFVDRDISAIDDRSHALHGNAAMDALRPPLM